MAGIGHHTPRLPPYLRGGLLQQHKKGLQHQIRKPWSDWNIIWNEKCILSILISSCRGIKKQPEAPKVNGSRSFLVCSISIFLHGRQHGPCPYPPRSLSMSSTTTQLSWDLYASSKIWKTAKGVTAKSTKSTTVVIGTVNLFLSKHSSV